MTRHGVDAGAVDAALLRELRAVRPSLPEDLSPASDFREDWRLDSLDLVEFVARVERVCGILIPDEDLPRFVSMAAASEYVQARLAAGMPEPAVRSRTGTTAGTRARSGMAREPDVLRPPGAPKAR